uniref:Candidate secreted effector n=1 Tax=Meloidogyne incognita TaxID=6306 RepID=A0A914M1U3_MELIC
MLLLYRSMLLPCCSCCLCHKGPICIRLPCTCPCCCKCCGCCCCSPQSCLSCCGGRRKRHSHNIRDFLPKSSCSKKNNDLNESRLLLTKTIFY